MTPSRTLPVLGIATAALLAAGFAASAEKQKATGEGRAPLTLLGTLADWTYPGSERIGEATMSDGGNPRIQSVKCTAVLTTPDPVEKVADYYEKKFATPENAGPEIDAAKAASVNVLDDSNGRPVSVRVVTVHRADTSTTLAISRGKDERLTHIAWSHYIRLGDLR
jgi:hypothetical protein